MIALREYFTDNSGKALVPLFSASSLSIAFSSAAILGALVVATWPWQGMVSYMKEQRVPHTFSLIFMALLALHTYINLRLGRGELGVPSRFTREHTHQKFLPSEIAYPFFQYGLFTFCLHIGFLLLPGVPLFILATTLSSFSTTILLKTFLMVFTSALLCRVFGFFLYLLWGNSSVLGYFFARIFLAIVFYVSAFWGPPISPFRIILRVESDEVANGFQWTSPYLIYMALVLTMIGGFAILCDGLCRFRRQKENAL